MYLSGTVKKNWNDDFKYLIYTKQPVTEEEISCWRNQGYYHDQFTGNMYDNKNTMPDWVTDIGNLFPNLKNKTYTIYKMKTLEIMPTHIDHFKRYSELFAVNNKLIRRIIIFLEDWKPGHYFEIEGKGIVNWKAGDYYLWESNVKHAASNIGIEPRYTLQITGHV
jgi:hypothetical protein